MKNNKRTEVDHCTYGMKKKKKKKKDTSVEIEKKKAFNLAVNIIKNHVLECYLFDCLHHQQNMQE